jgi:hypothetical protein
MEASVRTEVHAFLEQVEQQYEPALTVIRNHPFVQGVAQGTVSLAILRQFAHAEYWYMRGGVKHFALSIMAAPDLETQRFYHQRLSGELEYLERFRPFLQALGLAEEVLDRSWPAPRTLSAVNFLFCLSVEGSPADKAIAWFCVVANYLGNQGALKVWLCFHVARGPGCHGGPRNCQRRFDAQRPAGQPPAILCVDKPRPARRSGLHRRRRGVAARGGARAEKELALDAVRQRPSQALKPDLTLSI